MLNLFLVVVHGALAATMTVLSLKVVRWESRAREGSQSESSVLTCDICDQWSTIRSNLQVRLKPKNQP